MSLRIPESEAIKLMKAAGLQPLVPYESLNKPWPSKCLKCAREVSPRLGSIKRGSAGCRFCSGKVLDPNEAVLIMKKAGLDPLVPYPGNDTPWHCRCQKCHRETFPRFHGVKSRGSGCKYCSGNASVLSEVILEMESYNLTPIKDYPGAGKPWECICKDCGKTVKPRIADIRMGHAGCVYCSRVSQGESRRLSNNQIEMATVYLVMSEAGLEPLEPFTLSNAKWKCKCKTCGVAVSPSYSQIQSGSGGCKACGNRRRADKTRLDQLSAFARMQDAKWEPIEEYRGANKPWKCKCLECGVVSSPAYAHIQQGRKGCKTCGIKKHTASRRLPEEKAVEIANKAGFVPLEPYLGRHYPWKCRCSTCNEIVSPQLGGIIAGNGCLNCSGRTIDPVLARSLMLQNKLEPLVDYPGAGVPWKCKCLKCNREVFPRYSQIKSSIGGCKYCATHGYDFSVPGIFYVLTNLELEAHKIGITNIGAKEKRLEKHAKQGWVTYETLIFENGNNAYEVEQEILNWIRIDLGLPVYLGKAQMPQGGFTETVDAKEIDLYQIFRKAQEFAEKYRGSTKFLDSKTSMPRRTKK